ncbi:AzlD domain-containing protein [Butyrivibrio sp. INlla16]|uniref:AzlD domain-containing protein n=1 Tax=Butyrivibrio sp. INlla16 TaxID=1520807 RepID=UPI00088791A2|nr:AzlD domain-containing protein [Butyrivibrio sp. INlla16]SDB69194.1 Branched-chain amino acid transport protein [Butyrivibrio sp. INlla16]
MHNIFGYIFVMALVTYLVRMLPLTLIRRDINSRFVKSFLYYVPYATLAAMTFPAIIHASDSMRASVIGFAVALGLSFRKRSLLTVAVAVCAAVFVAEWFLI